jgi:CysZ protein
MFTIGVDFGANSVRALVVRSSEAVALRRRHSGQVYLAGVIISGLVAVAVLNLLTPLFATAFMTRLYRRLG